MTAWQRKLKLQPEWDQAAEHEIPLQQLAGVIAARLKALRPFNIEDIDDYRDELVEEFQWLAKQENLTADEFDDKMSELYDWGDIKIGGGFFDAKKVCWIDRFGG